MTLQQAMSNYLKSKPSEESAHTHIDGLDQTDIFTEY